MKNQKGFTLLEMILVLMIIGLLICVLLPVVGGRINDARLVNGRINVERIYAAIQEFYNDLGFYPQYKDGKKVPAGGSYDVLYSRYGAVPASIDQLWLTGSTSTDFIEDQLIVNEPVYKEKDNPQASHGWSGPYLSSNIAPDPWGNKYFVNVKWLDENGKPSEQHRVWVLSAGPNETIDTPFSQLQTTGELQGDDIGLAIIH